MYYVDSNTLISYLLYKDLGHAKVKEFLENVAREGGKLYASSLTLLRENNF